MMFKAENIQDIFLKNFTTEGTVPREKEALGSGVSFNS